MKFRAAIWIEPWDLRLCAPSTEMCPRMDSEFGQCHAFLRNGRPIQLTQNEEDIPSDAPPEIWERKGAWKRCRECMDAQTSDIMKHGLPKT